MNYKEGWNRARTPWEWIHDIVLCLTVYLLVWMHVCLVPSVSLTSSTSLAHINIHTTTCTKNFSYSIACEGREGKPRYYSYVYQTKKVFPFSVGKFPAWHASLDSSIFFFLKNHPPKSYWFRGSPKVIEHRTPDWSVPHWKESPEWLGKNCHTNFDLMHYYWLANNGYNLQQIKALGSLDAYIRDMNRESVTHRRSSL